MFGKQQRSDMCFLLWYGEKALAGDPPTPEEQERFIRARQQSVRMAKLMMNLKDEDFAYTPGEEYSGP